MHRSFYGTKCLMHPRVSLIGLETRPPRPLRLSRPGTLKLLAEDCWTSQKTLPATETPFRRGRTLEREFKSRRQRRRAGGLSEYYVTSRYSWNHVCRRSSSRLTPSAAGWVY